jgi:thymidylate kinase
MPLSGVSNNSGATEIPRLIFITGVDGSGKSLFTQKLIGELKGRGLPAVHLWSRFNNITSKPLLAFCRLVGLNYYETTDGILVGYHDFEKSRVISWCFIFCQLIDIWIVTLCRIWPRVAAGKILVCDRGAYDTLIDVMVDTKNRLLCHTFVGRLFLLLLPKRHKVFLLNREPEAIFALRPDVRADKNFDLRRQLYNDNAKLFKWETIENNGAKDNTLSELISRITC